MRAIALLAAALLLAVPGLVPPGAAAADQTIHLFCDGSDGGLPMLEYGYVHDGCWAHLGIHTYFVGRDTVYRLMGGSGQLFSVEGDLSPPWPTEAAVDVGNASLGELVAFETSMDGESWHQVASTFFTIANVSDGVPERENLYFAFTGDQSEFRFLRVRQPLSATQGLSGYLDFSTIDLDVQAVRAVEPIPLTHQEGVAKSCDHDIMESPWSLHPCWYGAVGYYDAPSFFHTYFLGDSRLDRVQGTVQFVYFRAEDVGQFTGGYQPIGGVLNGKMRIQVSPDGLSWTNIALQPVSFEQPASFDLQNLGGVRAAFLRIASDWNPGYYQHVAALKHPTALLLSSSLNLTGELPG